LGSIAGGSRHTPAARIAKIALAVELADVPWLLVADPVDGADEVAVGHRVGGLLQLPQIFGEPRHGRRRVEDDLGPGQPERARALGEVAVITDVDTDRPHPRSKHRIAEIAGTEVELLPEAGRAVAEVALPVLAEVAGVGVDDGGRVVI